MSIALRQSQMDIFDFIALFSVAEPSDLFHEPPMPSTDHLGRSDWYSARRRVAQVEALLP